MNGAEGHFGLIMVQRNMFFQHGLKLMSERDYAGAQQFFKTILQNIPDLQAKYQLARCFQFSKDYDSAILTYEEVFMKNPEDPRPVYQQGFIYDIRNQIDLAIKHYEKAANILSKYTSEQKNDPKFSIIYYQLGCKYEQRNELERAKRAFTQFLEFPNISENDKKKGNKKILNLNIPLDVSETQQYKSKYHQEARQQSFIKQKNIDEEKIKMNAVRQLDIIGNQQFYLNDVKDELYQKKDVRKPGDSGISSQQSTAEKHPSIRPSINLISVPLDDYSSCQKINNLQQQEYRFITQNNIPPPQNNINPVAVNNSTQQQQQQQNNIQSQNPQKLNSPPQKSESTIKLNSNTNTNPNTNRSNIINHQHHNNYPNSNDSNQNQSVSNQTHFESFQYNRNRITFDQTSPKEMWDNNQEHVTDINVRDKYEEVQNHNFLYPPYEECEDSLNISDDDIPDEKDGKMMQNKTSFNNTHTIKNIPMKSFIELTYTKPTNSAISGYSQLSHSRFSLLHPEQGSQINQKQKDFEHIEKSLSAYKIQKQLGEGSYGYVYEVIYKADGNSFALKVIPNNSILRQHLTSGEIDVMKSLNHKNIIKIYNAFKSDDQQSYCIISELADNGTLKDYIKQKRGIVDKYEVLNLMKQMITALNYIHSQRIIHRDIKPGNIFLHGNSKQIKIGDFGIAKKLTNKEIQQDMHQVGTEKYFSPEYRNEGFSEKSDIWSMGIVFLELLGVQVNGELTDKNKMQYFKQIPPEMSDIIAGMTQVDPNLRFSSTKVINQLKLIK